MFDNENTVEFAEAFCKPPLDVKAEKKQTAKLGLILLLMMVVMMGVQYLLDFLLSLRFPHSENDVFYMWLLVLIPQYCVAYPLTLWLFGKLPKQEISQNELTGRSLLKLFAVCYCLLIFGSLIGAGVNSILETVFGIDTTLEMDALFYDSPRLLILAVVVIIGPIFEELIFRKHLLDRLVKYGELPAAVASALLFALYHGNFSQFFYAFFVGLIFAYIYVKTGNIKYSIVLHMAVNFCGSLLPLLIDDSGLLILLAVYMVLELSLVVFGGVLLVKNRRRLNFLPSAYAVDNSQAVKIIWLNWGMIAVVICLCGLFAVDLIF